MQPLASSTIFSTADSPVTTVPSMPTSPISFMMIATGLPRSPCSRTWRRSVVFPLPRNPVRMSTATVRIRRRLVTEPLLGCQRTPHARGEAPVAAQVGAADEQRLPDREARVAHEDDQEHERRDAVRHRGRYR